MQLNTLGLSVALIVGACGASFAQDASQLSEAEIIRRLEAQRALAGERAFADQVAERLGMGTPAVGDNGVDGARGAAVRGNGGEVRMLRFENQAAADEFLVHGNLEEIVPHPMVFEQRGSYVAVVSGSSANEANSAQEALRQVWNAEVTANGNHRIPPVRTRAAYLEGRTIVETAIEDEAFVAAYDNAAYAGIPTEHSEGIRRMYVGAGAEDFGRDFRITGADTSPLRSRGDEGQFGRTRGLSLGGNNQAGNNGGRSHKGLGDLLQGN